MCHIETYPTLELAKYIFSFYLIYDMLDSEFPLLIFGGVGAWGVKEVS